ncbi:hypothetical protein IFT98_00070 [Pseudomonas sp. CFBP 8770]|uniref:Tc toxin subunit A n=1 Tax=unclassified Pseudomonas TaxID=196821 RepID=UPI00177EA4B2|nr:MULTISPECIES: Tc toxin subunit A [unclassified Pseudomonas]MBD8475355.1 hypothetical protein [Pseudomonas sp. CFBP 8773]MBD8645382.1 hypothetical protein [Pseudomonas sp. CFBP 8770]
MTTPERPDPVSEHGNEPPADNLLPVQPNTTPNPLFDNLVPATPHTRALDKMSFADAMPAMGMSSVFDIIRKPKAEFTRQLRTLSDADGDLAYDNAMCYATQIARSYREDVVSSGRDLPLIAPQTGVRALVDIGPSYPNLFKENWDQFCKVGAIEAMDGPVAYLGSLRRFAAEKIEGASTSPKRIPLAVRRPDLDTLVIDEQSTYQSVPMLDLVNNVLSQGIAEYQKVKGDTRPIDQLLADKKHPFVFPYHFAHQQVSLALGGDKPGLGEINHALCLAGGSAVDSPLAQINSAALPLMSGLSPRQQQLLTQPLDFATFNISMDELDRTQEASRLWMSPVFSTTYMWADHKVCLLLPTQPELLSSDPQAETPVANQGGQTTLTIAFSNGTESKTLKLQAYVLYLGTGASQKKFLNSNISSQSNSNQGHCMALYFDPAENPGVDLSGDYRARLLINVRVETDRGNYLARQWRLDLYTRQNGVGSCPLSESEAQFMKDHLGTAESEARGMSLASFNTLCGKTELDADQLEALLCQKGAYPKLSPNCPMKHSLANIRIERRSPGPMNYGACFINGNGGLDAEQTDKHHLFANAINLHPSTNGQATVRLLHTSPDRLDRLQRMVRLQRWTGLPFAELDTLIVSAMRAEGDRNSGLDTNQNTLRVLGAYRYFSRHYAIGAEEFAAFVHDITPFACGARIPLLDRIFNSPVLFGAPLVLDRVAFSHTSTEPAQQTTVNQLCAGLGVSPETFAAIAAHTITSRRPLSRSLPVVSSLYRQARIAGMFGLSVDECLALITLLGGNAYHRSIADGELKSLDSMGKDILDILMELDEAVHWLNTHKTTVTGLLALMDGDDTPAPASPLVERLQRLANDSRGTAVTPTAVAGLGLPGKADGAPIDWHAELAGGAQAIVDTAGLVKALSMTVTDTDREQLIAKVSTLVDAVGPAADAVAATVTTLTDYLFSALSHQQRLVEGLLQEHTGLIPELALWVSRCAEVSPYQLLELVSLAWPVDADQDEAAIDLVVANLTTVSTCARAISWANVDATALRHFVVNPSWLGDGSLWPLTLKNLQSLKAYNTLFNTLGQPEERLLGYLQQANALVSRRPGKRQLAVQSQTCNAALASLLGWSESEVAMLTALLPQQTAKTVAHIDWVRRAQALALETGLNAATLLKACTLNADSPEADWQAVGQAAMAAAGR